MTMQRFLRVGGRWAIGLMPLAQACIEPDGMGPRAEQPMADAQVLEDGGIDASSPSDGASGAEADALSELPADAGDTDAGDTDAGKEERPIATRWVLTDGTCAPPLAPTELRHSSARKVLPRPSIKYQALCLPWRCDQAVEHLGPVCGRISDGCGGFLCGCAQCDEADYCDGEDAGLCRTGPAKGKP